MNVFKRQSICLYLLFGLSNMDFDKRKLGLPFTRLIGDDSIAEKLYKKHL